MNTDIDDNTVDFILRLDELVSGNLDAGVSGSSLKQAMLDVIFDLDNLETLKDFN